MELLSHADPKDLQEFITLKNDPQFFIAESERVIEKLFLTDFQLSKALVTESFYNQNKDELCKRIDPKSIYIGEKKELENIVGYKLHHGVMIKAHKPANASLERLGDRILIFDALAGAENIGSIIRTASAFGFDSFICSPNCIDPYIRRSVRVSMGNIFHSQVHYSKSLKYTIQELQNNRYTVYAAENRPWSKEITDTPPSDKMAIIIGSEANGIHPDLFDFCDATIKIPIEDKVYALNASIAASILAFYYRSC